MSLIVRLIAAIFIIVGIILVAIGAEGASGISYNQMLRLTGTEDPVVCNQFESDDKITCNSILATRSFNPDICETSECKRRFLLSNVYQYSLLQEKDIDFEMMCESLDKNNNVVDHYNHDCYYVIGSNGWNRDFCYETHYSIVKKCLDRYELTVFYR